MAIGYYIVVKLQEEGIEDVDDLEIVDKYFLKQLTENLKRPGDQINEVGVMVLIPDLKLGAKSQKRLEADSNIL